MDRLAATGHGDVTRVHAEPRDWRLRVGPWRVRFVFEFDTHIMRILHVLPRGSAYRE